LCQSWGEARIRRLFADNPAAVLVGREIDTDAQRAPVVTKAWWQFWR
jgi:hypothetical protein